MGRIIVFNATKIGASHIKSGKPCQDNSLSWMSEDGRTQVAIVCDAEETPTCAAMWVHASPHRRLSTASGSS